MFAERLNRARKAAGLSMDALANEVGVSANAIKKYEHGESMPTSGNLIKLAKALDVRSEYFFRPVRVELQGVEYRKRSSTPKKILSKINADVLEQAERWSELLQFYPDSVKPVPPFEVPADLPAANAYEDIENVALALRQIWSMGLNPVPDMIDTLESRGIMIISSDVESDRKFDGLAGTIGQTPIVVISSHQPGDRQRFTLAHELGHLVLAGRLAGELDMEKACNRFAGAFLLPRPALEQHLGKLRHGLESQELFMLKHEFGISMMGALMRAAQCDIISATLLLESQKLFSVRGWRTQEPGKPYPREATLLFKQLVYRALAEDYIGESKAAELLSMPLSLFHKERKLESMDAVADQ